MLDKLVSKGPNGVKVIMRMALFSNVLSGCKVVSNRGFTRVRFAIAICNCDGNERFSENASSIAAIEAAFIALSQRYVRLRYRTLLKAISEAIWYEI